MNKKTIIEIEPYKFTLYKDGDNLIFNSLCGTVALFEIEVKLTPEETELYKINGKNYLNTLYLSIIKNPEFYQDRNKKL